MKSIEALKERLSEENTLVVQSERGFIMEVDFLWTELASSLEIEQFENNNELTLPSNFKDFFENIKWCYFVQRYKIWSVGM